MHSYVGERGSYHYHMTTPAALMTGKSHIKLLSSLGQHVKPLMIIIFTKRKGFGSAVNALSLGSGVT